MIIKEVLDKLEIRIKKAKEAEDGEEFFSHLYYRYFLMKNHY